MVTDARAVLVLDIGSSSVRAWLYDETGQGSEPGPGAQRFYGWRTDPAGVMECDAEPLIDEVAVALDSAVAFARRWNIRIEAVGIAAFWHSVMGVDGAGNPTTPLYGWGDSRAREVAISAHAQLDEGAVHKRTGCYLHPSYPSIKLAWLRARGPTAFEAAAGWVSFSEFLEQRFFGGRRCSLSMASGTGLLDVHRMRWDPEMLGFAGIDEGRLSPLVDTDEPATGLRREWAARWPELRDVPWYPALGDGACANVGSGAMSKARTAVTVGTSAAVRVLWEPTGPVEIPDELWCYRLDARRWVAGGALSNGGNSVAFLEHLLKLPAEAEWRDRVARMEPDSHGLTILPYLVEERPPRWRSAGSGAIIGMTLATGPEQLVRAWMEAVAYRVAEVCDRIEGVLPVEPPLLASGGALHASATWAQIIADATGFQLLLPPHTEATSRGAALVVHEQLGWRAGLDDPLPERALRFTPDPERHERYALARQRQQRLQSALSELS